MATGVLASAPIATMLTSLRTDALTSVNPRACALMARPLTWTCSAGRTRL